MESTGTFSWTFKAIDHSSVYTKLWFWGDGNNILGLKPGSGGQSEFCFMPSADAPLSQINCKATAPCKHGTWYRIELEFPRASSVNFKVDGKTVGTGGSFGGSHGNPQMGCYHWGGPDKPYQLHFRDMCFGTATMK